MPAQLDRFDVQLGRAQVPQIHRSIPATGSQPAPVRAEDHNADQVIMTLQVYGAGNGII